jgi:Zn-dependent protease with chaperone function
MYSRTSRAIIFSIIIFFTGCVTIGPYIDNQELQTLSEDLKIKAVNLKMQRTVHVNEIGSNLLKNLPYQPNKSYGYTGILATSLDKYMAKIFNRRQDEGAVIVYGLVEASPAQAAGIQVGDIIARINDRKVTVYNYGSLIKSLKSRVPYWIEVERDGGFRRFRIYPESIPYYIDFLVVDSQEVNAVAFAGGVALTYGLLNFVENDDELGIVVGHELAHLMKGHILQSQGINLALTALILALSKNVDISQTEDLGRLLGSASSASFSRGFEREADFLGTLIAYKSGFDIGKGVAIWERFAIEIPKSLDSNFLSTHPTSSERLLRIQELVEEIESGQIKVDEYLK